MEQLIMLGTGNALAVNCYNTCFAIRNNNGVFLTDTGGGNGIFKQLERAEIRLHEIHEIVISHEHIDHILGCIWLIRMIATKMKNESYEGNLLIYCHKELAESLKTIIKLTVQEKFYRMIGERILFICVNHGENHRILDYDVTFFDIGSTKAKQYGYTLKLTCGKKLTFLGDEPYRGEYTNSYVLGTDWLLSEAFCRYADRDIFHPYEKHHATVKEACETAKMLEVKNLVLYHTEDSQLERRKEIYCKEGCEYYDGNIYVPYDLEKIVLC